MSYNEQLSYNDKMKADIAAQLKATSERKDELARLQAENAALVAWAKLAHSTLSYIASRIDDDTYANMIGYQNNGELLSLLGFAPDSVKGGNE